VVLQDWLAMSEAEYTALLSAQVMLKARLGQSLGYNLET